MSMITIRNLQFQYDAAPEINALYGIDLEIRKGECVILTGESGCGKTTLTRCLNGLIPNFFEGTLTGEILYEGVPVNKLEQYELSRKIGTVFQDPRSQFFAVNTTDEVAFGCENLAFSTERINQNVDAAFSRMNIDVLRDRSLFGLSFYEYQSGCYALNDCICFARRRCTSFGWYYDIKRGYFMYSSLYGACWLFTGND